MRGMGAVPSENPGEWVSCCISGELLYLRIYSDIDGFNCTVAMLRGLRYGHAYNYVYRRAKACVMAGR